MRIQAIQAPTTPVVTPATTAQPATNAASMISKNTSFGSYNGYDFKGNELGDMLKLGLAGGIWLFGASARALGAFVESDKISDFGKKVKGVAKDIADDTDLS